MAFDGLLKSAFSHISTNSVYKTIRQLAYGLINCEGKATITSMITGVGRQHVDWSAFYRVFSQVRFDICAVFHFIFLKAVEQAAQDKFYWRTSCGLFIINYYTIYLYNIHHQIQ